MNPRPPLLPIFLDLAGRIAFLLGDGEAAERRAATLLGCGAVLRRETDRFSPELLHGCAIAVGAEAPDDALLAMVAEARARGIPYNVVDRPALCGFSTPAVVSRAPLQVAIASGGAAPVLARLLRARIETLIPPGFGRLAGLADRMQAETRRVLPDVLRRRRLLERLLSGRVAALVLDGREADAEAEWRQALLAAAEVRDLPERGVVYLIETGAGEPDLLTLRALRVMGEADLILHDADESPAILELARRDAGRRVVGADAVAVITELAGAGAKLVRLSPSPGEAVGLVGDFDVIAIPGACASRVCRLTRADAPAQVAP